MHDSDLGREDEFGNLNSGRVDVPTSNNLEVQGESQLDPTTQIAASTSSMSHGFSTEKQPQFKESVLDGIQWPLFIEHTYHFV